MNKLKISALSIVAALGVSQAASAEEITIATVNNADMITMQELAPAWEEATGNKINWVVLEENVPVSYTHLTLPTIYSV